MFRLLRPEHQIALPQIILPSNYWPSFTSSPTPNAGRKAFPPYPESYAHAIEYVCGCCRKPSSLSWPSEMLSCWLFLYISEKTCLLYNADEEQDVENVTYVRRDDSGYSSGGHHCLLYRDSLRWPSGTVHGPLRLQLGVQHQQVVLVVCPNYAGGNDMYWL